MDCTNVNEIYYLYHFFNKDKVLLAESNKICLYPVTIDLQIKCAVGKQMCNLRIYRFDYVLNVLWNLYEYITLNMLPFLHLIV